MTVAVHRFANGFRVVTERMPGVQSAAVGIWVSAGGRHERPDQNGIAHFLEHMAFKGTRRRSAQDIAEQIEDVGGYINAYTSRETTAYYARVLGADVDLAIDVIADILRDPALAPDEIEVERGVILQEIGQALDTPDDIVFDWLQEAAYPGQAIGRTILGAAERVRGFARDDLARFVGERYTPGDMILAAAGDVDHDAVVRAAEAAFGDMTATRPDDADPAAFEGGEVRVGKPLEQVHFTFAFETPGYLADDVYVGQLYAIALGGGMSSRLFQELRERRGLCYSVFAQAAAYADTGLTTIYAGTGPDSTADLARLTMDEIRRTAEDLTDAEMERARAQMKAGLLMGLESVSSRAERLARMLAIWDRVPEIGETVARIDAVTPAQLRDFATGVAERAPAALAIYGPGAEAAPSLAELRERLRA